MNILEVAKKTIKKPKNETKVIFENGKVDDIVKVILLADLKSGECTKKFAKFLKGKTIKETCKNIFNFLKNNIKYIKDIEGVQDIKSPCKTFYDGFADCKSLSIFAASILKNLKIPYKYRLASYSELKIPTHIYVIALDEKKKIL
jgi:hypothetical protein